MKTLLAVLAPLVFAVSCAPSTPGARIAKNPQLYERLSPKDKQLVSTGRVARGMSMDAVWLSWGEPDRRFEGAKEGKALERWDYTTSEPTYTTGFYGGLGYGSFGRYGYRGYGLGLGPEITYVPTLNANVTFLNRKVDSWERKR